VNSTPPVPDRVLGLIGNTPRLASPLSSPLSGASPPMAAVLDTWPPVPDRVLGLIGNTPRLASPL